MNKISVKQNLLDYLKIVISSQFILLCCLTVNAQQTEKTEDFVRRQSNGTEIYRRKFHTVVPFNQVKKEEMRVHNLETDLTTQEFRFKKIETVLKNPVSKQEVIIWSKNIYYPVNESAFNYFEISDVCEKDGKYYVLYYEGLEVRVITIIDNAGVWHSENDTFLEETSESIHPITEAKFIGKKPKIFLKRDIFYAFLHKEYEWKLKNGKWILIKEKEVKTVPPWVKKYKSK